MTKFIRDVGWLTGAEALNRVFRLTTTVILARMFNTQEYGELAIIFTIYDLSSVFTCRGGIGAKLIQAGEAEIEELSSAAFQMTKITCTALTALLMVSTIPLANLYNDNGLILPLCMIALTYLVAPYYSIHSAHLTRLGRFDVVAKATVIQSFVGNALVIILVVLGAGIWSVVIPLCLSNFIWLIVFKQAYTWYPTSCSITKDSALSILNFGLPVLGAEILLKLRANIDYILVGALFSTAALGSYYFAFNAGLGVSLSVISGLSVSSYSLLCNKAQENQINLSNSYWNILRTCTFIVIPLMVLQIGLAVFYVPIVFGSKWSHAVSVLRLVCLSAPAIAYIQIAGNLLNAIGKTNTNFLFGVSQTILFTLGILLAINYIGTIESVALFGTISNWISAFIIMAASITYLKRHNEQLSISSNSRS